MPVRSCRVTVADIDGVNHTAQVTASTLFEAVALGLAAIRGSDWVVGLAQGLNTVRVEVKDVPVEHEVKLEQFMKWLGRGGGSPKDVSDRNRARQILGLPAPK